MPISSDQREREIKFLATSTSNALNYIAHAKQEIKNIGNSARRLGLNQTAIRLKKVATEPYPVEKFLEKLLEYFKGYTPQELEPTINLIMSAPDESLDKYRSSWIILMDPRQGQILLGKRSKNSNNPNQWNFLAVGLNMMKRTVKLRNVSY